MNFKEEIDQNFEYLIRLIFIFNEIDKKFLSEEQFRILTVISNFVAQLKEHLL